MLKFLVFEDGQPASSFPLRGAHLLGADDVGMRGSVRFENGMIICEKAALGSAALALQVAVEDVGELILQTCLLPDREEPYYLFIELARQRLMKMLAKQEDWALFEVADDHPAARRIALAKKKFIEALSATDNPAEAQNLAKQALVAGIDASEELALAHAGLLLERRNFTGAGPRNIIGCGVGLNQRPDRLGSAILGNFDYLRINTPWRQLEPTEQEHNWAPLDAWCEWAFRNKLPVVAGPIVSFSPQSTPDWLYIWEHDYDTVRDLLYEHIERVVQRYRGVVTLWNVVSGVHVNNHFTFNFEQLMDVTRMSIMLVKKVQPNARTLIEITHPFGEYYAANPRSIPPIMYAEMVLQAGIPFDGFGLKLLVGQGREGQTTRDLMAISGLIDRFNGLGKPVHITGVAAPSEPQNGAAGDTVHAGYWRKPWSAAVQAHWLEAMYHVALSKPFVESISWLELMDREGSEMPTAGLINDKLQPRPAYKRLITLRKSLHEA
jgi:GH35 family endo-1,4-beta-xylanase